MKDFRSDNTLGASPEILDAIARASAGSMTSYGADEITARVRKRCSDIFGREVDVFPVLTGTAANALAIAALAPPFGAVFCHEDAHVQRDELGAVEFFSGGAKLILIDGVDGKLHPRELERSIDEVRNSKMTAVPACLSLTNATEAGTVYTNEEVGALCELARRNRLSVHLDGARFANAFVAGGTDIHGVDILSFGASKNGTLAGDVIVVFNRTLSEEVSLRWHRAGQRLSKMRFLSAQLEAYLTNDVWLRNAGHANAMAARLRDAIGGSVEIVRPVDANMVFVRCPPPDGFLFGDWPIFGPDVYRIVMGFSTSEQDVDELAQSLIRSRSIAM